MSTISNPLYCGSRLSRLCLVFVCVLCLVLFGARSPITAQTPTIDRAKITQVLDGSQVFIQNKQARLNDSASKGQRVRTGETRAQLTFNTGAIGRLAHNSVLTVGQCARLQQGTLLVNGAMNGCTASIVAGVRGTTYVLEADANGTARIKVLEGEVTVKRQHGGAIDTEPAGNKQFSLPSIPKPSLPLPEPSPAPAPDSTDTTTSDPATLESNSDQIVLRAGEKISVSRTGALGLIEKLTQKDFTNLLRGNLFNGFSAPLPGMAKIQASFQQLFPGVPFPIQLPSVPSLPIPIRLPF